MVTCQEMHERAKRDSSVWALLIPIGEMPTFHDEPGKPTRLVLANCPKCHSTIAKEMP